MPGDPRECREHAKCCLKQAAAAASPVVRENFLKLAQSWMRLARELEATERLLAALEEVPIETPPTTPMDPNARGPRNRASR